METLKDNFIQYLEIERGRSSLTTKSYMRCLDVFIVQSKIHDVSKITTDKVRAFRMWLNSKTQNKRTQNYHLIVLRSFLKYLAKIGIASLPADSIELAKVSDRQINVISSDELERLIEATNSELDIAKRYRDRAILEMLFSTGLRVSELCGLAHNINLDNDELSVCGKGGHVRVVFLSKNATRYLKEYINSLGGVSGKLFKIDRRTVNRIVGKYATLAKLNKKVTPHMIRHVFATNLLSNGADIRSVQALLGHKNIATTQIYTHVTDSHLRSIHHKYHGNGAIINNK